MQPGAGVMSGFGIPEAGRSGMNEILLGPEGINEAPLFTSAMMGAILTVITIVILLPFKESKIYAVDVLINRGFWPYAMIYTFWLGIAMIIWKLIGLTKLTGTLKKSLIPPQTTVITPKNTDGVLQNIASIYKNVRVSPLAYRLWMALLIFKQTSQVERVDAYCSSQSDAEGGNMDASYQIINFCLWLQPIFGFLGTVQGLGLALAGFGNIAGSAMEIDTIKGALASVTGGLSTAFDTTLLGLFHSVIMMSFITLVKKSEDNFLANVDTWIKENLMPKLKAPKVNLDAEAEGGGVSPSGHFQKVIKETFETYIQSLEDSFEGWKDGFTGILKKLGQETESMGEHFESVKPIVTDFREAMDDFSTDVKETSEHQKGLIEAVDTHFGKLEPMITGFQKVAENLDQERQQLDQQMKTWAQNLNEVGKSMAQQLQDEGTQFLTKADQFQKQVNENATQMSAAVGQKLVDSGQGILTQFQQHIQEFSNIQKEQTAMTQNQVDNLSKLSDTISQNMAQMGENILKKLESQTGGMENLQKGLTTYLGQFDGFSKEFQNNMKTIADSQGKNMEALSAKTMEVFKTQLTEWFRNFSQEQSTFSNNLTSSFTSTFSQVGQEIMGQFGQYAQKQDQSISQVMQELKGLEQSFGNLSNQLGSAFSKLGQDMGTANNQNIQKVSELIQQCQQMTQDISNTSNQSVQGLSALSTQNQALVETQKEIAQLLSQHTQGLSSSEANYATGIGEIQKLLANQQNLMAALNEGIKQQTNNNSGVKEALEGLNPSMTNLVEFLKSKN